METTPRLGLRQIVSGQALKHITHNEALQQLDMLVQAVVEAVDIGAPPETPLVGEAFIVPAGASGAWAGHGQEIAAWQEGAWSFIDPAEGWLVFERRTQSLLVFSGMAWIALASLGAGLKTLGINASADTVNRLVLAGAATLLSHDGEGHQLKINKAGTGETGSLLFQTNWSGRAEMGLMGDDSWRIKVSGNGQDWTTGLTIRSDGRMAAGGDLVPATDNASALGSSSARWSAIWTSSGLIETSDERHKTDIADTDLGLDFIRALRPVRYRLQTGGKDSAVHYGLVAQEVLQTATEAGVARFGGHVLVDPGDADSQQALRYSSFIAPMIAAIKTLAQRIEALESGL